MESSDFMEDERCCNNSSINYQTSPPRDSRWNHLNESVQPAACFIPDPERKQCSCEYKHRPDVPAYPNYRDVKTVRQNPNDDDLACWWERRPATWTTFAIPQSFSPHEEHEDKRQCNCCPCAMETNTGFTGMIEINRGGQISAPISMDDTMVIKRPTNYAPWWEKNGKNQNNDWDKSMPGSSARKPRRLVNSVSPETS